MSAHDRLTPAERLVLDVLCVAGESNVVIAQRIGITSGTVKFHLTNALSTSGQTNRTAVALWWLRVGRWPYLLEELERAEAERASSEGPDA
jgi:DNA-binding NarL/FixJ family response regulator